MFGRGILPRKRQFFADVFTTWNEKKAPECGIPAPEFMGESEL